MALVAGVCALATGKVAEAQATCQGSLATSSSSVPALVKFIPAATRSGVVFHAWLDANRTPSAGHLVVENTNPYPVAVRFDAELWGAAGTVAGGSRCVWLRPREFAVAVHQYPAGTLSAVRVGDAEVSRIEPPPVRVASGLVPPRASRPRTRAAEPAASRPASAPSRSDTSSSAPSETSPSTPARRRDTAAASRRETTRPIAARVRDTAASTPRRERISPTPLARRDTATRSALPRRETTASAARRETVARASEARRDTAARTTAPRRETRAPTARRDAVARAAAPHRVPAPAGTRREAGQPTWTNLGDTPVAASRGVPPSRATRRDTAIRVSAPRVTAVAPALAPRRETAAPDTSLRAAGLRASRPVARAHGAIADSAGAAAMTARVADEPADSMLSGAPVIAPRPAPSRSHEGEAAESYLPAAVTASGTVSGGTAKEDAAGSVKLREDAPPLAKTGTTVFSVAFAALMVPAGIVLLMAIGGVVWLLAASALRRAWPGRRRH